MANRVNREIAAAQVRPTRELLGQVNCALVRVKLATWGTCEGCDEPIAEKRLAVAPWAAYCTKCQRRQEAGK